MLWYHFKFVIIILVKVLVDNKRKNSFNKLRSWWELMSHFVKLLLKMRFNTNLGIKLLRIVINSSVILLIKLKVCKLKLYGWRYNRIFSKFYSIFANNKFRHTPLRKALRSDFYHFWGGSGCILYSYFFLCLEIF